jgi:hypothetical protein
MARQLFQYHDTIGYQFVPGIKARVEHESGGYLLRTNRDGFRCARPFERERRSGTFRVLLFGDSYTAGDGVSDKHRYGEVLEGLLPGLEIYNYGLPGSGTDQQYLIWRELACEVEHDLVVIGVLVENIRRIVAHYREFETPDGEPTYLAKPYYSLDAAGALALHNVPVPRAPLDPERVAREAGVNRGGRFEGVRRLVNRLDPRVKDLVQKWTRYQPLPGFDRPDHPDWLLMKAILERWIHEIPGPVVICPIPLYQYIEETASPAGYLERFNELAAPPRVVVHDPLPDFQRAPKAERRSYRFEKDCHLTPAAHEILAKSLARRIEPMMNSLPAEAAPR